MKVNLTQDHIDQMKEIIIECDQYKRRNLSERSFTAWRDWAIKAADQINENEFEINSKKNTFNWLVDQIQHCPKVASTELGRTVLEWLPLAGQGPLTYLSYCRRQSLTSLFE